MGFIANSRTAAKSWGLGHIKQHLAQCYYKYVQECESSLKLAFTLATRTEKLKKDFLDIKTGSDERQGIQNQSTCQVIVQTNTIHFRDMQC